MNYNLVSNVVTEGVWCVICVLVYVYNIYRQCHHCRQTYGHSKRLQTMNTTNQYQLTLRAQLNPNLWDFLFTQEKS